MTRFLELFFVRDTPQTAPFLFNDTVAEAFSVLTA
jgi:hypothetical protein